MIYIIIPIFNRLTHTKQCLDALREQTSQLFRTVVVDDGSTDDSIDIIHLQYPEVIVLQTKGDVFWTGTTNVGIEYALKQADLTYVMTLNNDTVPEKDFIEQMLNWSNKRPEALLGAFAKNYQDKKPIYGGEILDWRWNKYSGLLDKLDEDSRIGLHKVTHFPGRGLLIPKAVLDKIGLFDEVKFPHYYADYDFTLRAAKAGFELFCNYDAIIYTYPEASGDRQNRKQKSLKNYYQHLFGIRGGGNLGNFTRFALRHCPPAYLPYYLANGYTRRLLGYFLKK